MDQDEGLTKWFLGMLVSAVASLAASGVILLRYIGAKFVGDIADLKVIVKELQGHVDDCNEDRVELAKRIAVLEDNSKQPSRNSN